MESSPERRSSWPMPSSLLLSPRFDTIHLRPFVCILDYFGPAVPAPVHSFTVPRRAAHLFFWIYDPVRYPLYHVVKLQTLNIFFVVINAN